ncbi:MBL fold metallo-hydrolase [Desulfosporosinus sp. Sb-LF]|uniref:MBL fold metallo-hydrolase n=1 Tax=Desulfosporosinus sp. Sb-LF TaxID=2560027 RepID=UPI00107F06D5|nr:MBL fold metallo-hydrolase [Desulfosporosinus sp. Sb-LF]TGE33295.1 MBL fold metallo-hydrolase [Desulfosporosinus sp. Sb-LF]
MNIAKGVETLELTMNIMGDQSIIHPTLIWDDETIILLDAGMPSQLPEIRKVMDQVGAPFSKLNKVILTHQDLDHMSGLSEILRLSDHKVEVLAHKEERPYIQGEKPLIKLNPEQMAKRLESLPEEKRKQMEKVFKASLKLKFNVDSTIDDGEVLPYCGGITVIHTPGHTPGHICLYLNQSKTLITGDALNVIDGQMVGPKPEYAADINTAKRSLMKLIQYDIQTVICYHGGVYNDKVNQRLLELANE